MKKRWVLGAAVLIVVGGGYLAADHIANEKLRARAEIFAGEMRKVTREFRYGSVQANLLGHAIVMKNIEFVTLAGDRIKADSVAVKDFDWRNGSRPRYADLEIRRADVPASALGDLARTAGPYGAVIGLTAGPVGQAEQLLERAGYRRTVSDFFVSYRYDEATGELELRDFQLEIADLGRVTFNVKLGNVPNLNAKGGAQLLSYGTQVTLVGASLAFRDRSLVSRLLKAYAAERNLSEAEALARVLADLKAEHERSRDPIDREALAALIRFVERPGEIRLALEPQRPEHLLSLFTRILGGSSFKNRFGVTVTAR
jgi:hypothetical protein